MPRLGRIDDNASTTSSTAGLTRAERLANRQRLAAAAQVLIDVKNPTVVSFPLSAGGSPSVRSRGPRSLRLSNLNEEEDESGSPSVRSRGRLSRLSNLNEEDDESEDDAHVNNEDNDDDDSDD
jgi:hypothetical protein